jgi:hypothetical protein
MPGQFVEGIWVEKPVIEKLREDMFQSAALHHDEYNQTHNTKCTVTWLTSSNGEALVVFAANKQCADKIRRFVERLK